MAYKSVPAAGKRKAYKLVHLMLHFIALVSGIIGIYAVFKFHDELRMPHMFTLHSWIGMSTICLFAIQWVFGFLCFWWPGAEKGKRARLAPWHAFFGVVIFGMAILSAETGLVEKFVFLGLRRGHEPLILNFLGLLILLFAVFVGLSVLLPRG